MQKKRKRYNTKRSKRKNFLKVKIFCFTTLFLLIGGGLFYLLFLSPYFQIENLNIEGVETFEEDSLLSDLKTNSIISFNLFGNEFTSSSVFIPLQAKTASLLNDFSQIENINIHKNFFSKEITIEIIEKKPFCIWCENEKCVLLDKKATYIRDYSNETGLITINTFSNYEENLQNWCDKTKAEFLLLLKKITNEKNEITEYEIYSDKFFAKYNNIDLIFDPAIDIDEQIERMNIILEQLKDELNEIEYIKLMFEDQIPVK